MVSFQTQAWLIIDRLSKDMTLEPLMIFSYSFSISLSKCLFSSFKSLLNNMEPRLPLFLGLTISVRMREHTLVAPSCTWTCWSNLCMVMVLPSKRFLPSILLDLFSTIYLMNCSSASLMSGFLSMAI